MHVKLGRGRKSSQTAKLNFSNEAVNVLSESVADESAVRETRRDGGEGGGCFLKKNPSLFTRHSGLFTLKCCSMQRRGGGGGGKGGGEGGGRARRGQRGRETGRDGDQEERR